LHETYGEEVAFYLVYIREAHPTDGRQSRANAQEGIEFTQPTTIDERTGIARQMCQQLDIDLPTLIDGIDNKVNEAYAAQPDRIYLVDKQGRVAYKGGPGPHGFKPSELEEAIEIELLAE
jgi:hypothetical protein